jgi:KipI family sensor histidine kinase inhibitor
MTDIAIEPLSEDALLLRFGDGIDARTNARVHRAARVLRAAGLPGIVDIAPAYATLLVRLVAPAPGARDEALAGTIQKLLATGTPGGTAQAVAATDEDPARCVEIPVCYGGDFGPDLAAVADHAHLSADEVVARHAAADYGVAMLGFAPGFPYLLGLDHALQLPRRGNPRTRVPAGSVAIGGAQTGIYPRELPGGWHLIGRTPAVLFDPARNPPCLLGPGDRVRFRAIGPDEFTRIAGAGG